MIYLFQKSTKTHDVLIEQFLLKETNISGDKILLFGTYFNLKKLGYAPFLIMDCIFKTVSTVFKQLYIIHAPIGPHEMSRLLPLVYMLMSRKNTECYTQLFRNLLIRRQKTRKRSSPFCTIIMVSKQ